MLRIAKAEARKNFSEVVTRAGRKGERVKITHYGKTLAVLVSPSDLRKLHECEEPSAAASPENAAGAAPRRGQTREKLGEKKAVKGRTSGT